MHEFLIVRSTCIENEIGARLFSLPEEIRVMYIQCVFLELFMISRIWHGWTTPENADAYEQLLRHEIIE